MSHNLYPFAVRLIGFAKPEVAAFEENFAAEREAGYRYFHLDEHNLLDPDLYVANADDLNALAILGASRPSSVRPALLVGTPRVALPYPSLGRLSDWPTLLAKLDELIERRADVLSRLEASDVVVVPERRRRVRLPGDRADPAVYLKMRTRQPENGAVLIVDRNPAFRDYVSELLIRRNVPVAWAGDEMRAVHLCRQQPVAIVMINTSTPGVDPYRLCWAIKEKHAAVRLAVIFLVAREFVYDVQQANYVGADGYLYKPLAGQQLLSVLQKFLPAGR